MKPLLPRHSPHTTQNVARFAAGCMTMAALILAAPCTKAINHPPFVSWIPDQRIMTSVPFATKYFRIFNYDPVTFSIMKQSTTTFYSANNVMVSQCTTQQDFDNGCANDGTGYKVSFNASPTGDGVTTIILRANETGTGGLIGYTSFTLRKDSAGNNPPSVGALQNQAIQLPTATGSATYKTMFVVGDLDESNVEDIVDANGNSRLSFSPPPTSSNPAVLLDSGITVALMPADGISILNGPRTYSLTATTVAGATGPTTVTVNLTDPDGNTTSTSFVLQVIANTNAPPSFGTSSDGTYLVCPVPTPSPTPPQYHFTVVSNDGTDVQNLRITAISSNTKLVPNDSTHLVCSTPDPNGNGTVTIIPVLPLPSPSPGVPQTSTITLSVTDDAYSGASANALASNTSQSTFLYVVRDSSSPALSFSRPNGVYSLDPNLFQHRLEDGFLTGEMRRISWADMEKAAPDPNDHFDWTAIDGAVGALPSGQDLSLNLIQEPCYIAESTNLEFDPWCDTDTSPPAMCTPTPCAGGFKRAVPWDDYLRTRRDHFLDMLAQHVIPATGNTVANEPLIPIINTNLPGGDTGIRKVVVDFDFMSGYTREALLGAVQDELRTVQDKFPGKLVQIGFFPATDSDDLLYGNTTLWKWLYRDASNSTDANGVHFVALADEFNGIRRPRVSFFQENLAATRTSDTVSRSNSPNYVTPPLTTAYTFTPNLSFVPSFAYYSGPDNGQYNNGITFQANTPWSNPFVQLPPGGDGLKLIKTLNGSPNDGMEGAFNAYLSQYLEVYLPDIDQAKPQSSPPTLNAVLWAGELQSWHDYFRDLRLLAPIEAPAGLTVVRNLNNTNTVSWFAVYAPVDPANPVTYSVDRKMGMNWTSVCSSITARQCVDTATTGSSYAYRVRAVKGTNAPTPYAYVAGFLSEGGNDGYVSMTQAFQNASQPGIRAGEDAGTPGTDIRGILSFVTGSLNMGTVLTAKLRVKQFDTTNADFDILGEGLLDIEKGTFGNAMLQSTDFNASDMNTGVKVAQILPADLLAVPPNYWVESYLDATGVSKVNTSTTFMGGRTQFRLYFNHAAVSNTYVGWYSGEANLAGSSTPPQLIVQYTP